METFKIEKDVPLSHIHRSGYLYPFDQMEVNDSFFVPGKTATDICPAYPKNTDKKFTSRTLEASDDHEAGVRVWRVA